MSEVVEGGATLAWRLLATLEGGSLLLATSALLAYSARRRLAKVTRRRRRRVRTVLLTDTTNLLGQEIKQRLESNGCVVRTVTRDAASGAGGGADSGRVDALVIVGAHSPAKPTTLQTMANLVTDDVYHNLKTLESLALQVQRGGCIAWACAGAAGGSFRDVGEAFDTVLEANLRRVAQLCQCEPVWVGRSDGAELEAERLVAALLCDEETRSPGFSIRTAAHKVGEYILRRWLKIVCDVTIHDQS